MSDRYVVIDCEGVATNVIIWDGVTDWSPPEGCTVALEDSDAGRAALLAAQPPPPPADQPQDQQ